MDPKEIEKRQFLFALYVRNGIEKLEAYANENSDKG